MTPNLQNTKSVGGQVPYFADHGGEVSSIEERVLSVTNTRRVFSCFLIGEGSPLRPYINYTVTCKSKEMYAYCLII